MNKVRMTSSTASTLALPHTNWITQGESIIFTVTASLYINLGFEVNSYLNLGVIMKIKYCMLINHN